MFLGGVSSSSLFSLTYILAINYFTHFFYLLCYFPQFSFFFPFPASLPAAYVCPLPIFRDLTSSFSFSWTYLLCHHLFYPFLLFTPFFSSSFPFFPSLASPPAGPRFLRSQLASVRDKKHFLETSPTSNKQFRTRALKQ